MHAVKSNPAPERTDFAGAIASKLYAARTRLADLENKVGAAVLSAALDEQGAEETLASLNSKLQAAREEVIQLQAGHRFAANQDERASIAFEARARRDQLAKMQKVADARRAEMRKLCATIEASAKTYERFIELTAELAAVMPTGWLPHVTFSDLEMVAGGHSLAAPIDKIVANEAFRHARAHPLPGARPLVEFLRSQPALMESAVTCVERTNDWLTGMVRDKLTALEAADAAKLARSA